ELKLEAGGLVRKLNVELFAPPGDAVVSFLLDPCNFCLGPLAHAGDVVLGASAGLAGGRFRLATGIVHMTRDFGLELGERLLTRLVGGSAHGASQLREEPRSLHGVGFGG